MYDYKDRKEKNKISSFCLKLIFFYVGKNPDEIGDNRDLKIPYDFFMASFCKDVNIINSFVAIFHSSYHDMIMCMPHEADWEEGETLKIFKIAKLCLTILMVFLNYAENGKCDVSTFMRVAFDPTRKPNIIKLIAGFMNQYYNTDISKTACVVLKKISKVHQAPIITYLEMDYFQVKGMFLERLRDPLEDDEMKLLIIDFITACIESSQNGMCVAFFNIDIDKKDNLKSHGGSVTDFMVEHLKSLVENVSYINT